MGEKHYEFCHKQHKQTQCYDKKPITSYAFYRQRKQTLHYDKKQHITYYAPYLVDHYSTYTPPSSQHLWNRYWATSKFYKAY